MQLRDIMRLFFKYCNLYYQKLHDYSLDLVVVKKLLLILNTNWLPSGVFYMVRTLALLSNPDFLLN